ncbi:hypothetical protein BDW75DRAFT_247108 [Aspergillus navahoensis]
MHWAVSRGMRYSGITPTSIPGRGLGMVATRVIEENEELLTVPLSLMLTIDCVPPSFLELFPKQMSRHGILAAFLTHGGPEVLARWDAWTATWPTMQSFKECLPILWLEDPLCPGELDSRIFNVLPPSASGVWRTVAKKPKTANTDGIYQGILPKQQERLKRAWECTLSVFPDTEWNTFCHNWLIINTRSFYYVSTKMEASEDWNDNVGLVPCADYFNHADDPSCVASFDEQGYHFIATRRIEDGEEVFISYGSHPNDFFFVEYGFFLDNNPSDAIFLDDVIIEAFTPTELEELRLHKLYGEYRVSANGVCSRTEAAARLKYLDYEGWQSYIFGYPENDASLKKSMDVVRGWVTSYLRESLTVLQTLENMLKETRTVSSPQVATRLITVSERWSQIKQLCEAALRAIDAA